MCNFAVDRECTRHIPGAAEKGVFCGDYSQQAACGNAAAADKYHDIMHRPSHRSALIGHRHEAKVLFAGGSAVTTGSAAECVEKGEEPGSGQG